MIKFIVCGGLFGKRTIWREVNCLKIRAKPIEIEKVSNEPRWEAAGSQTDLQPKTATPASPVCDKREKRCISAHAEVKFDLCRVLEVM